MGTSLTSREFTLLIIPYVTKAFNLLNEIIDFQVIVPSFKRFTDDGDNIRNVERFGDEITCSIADNFLGIFQGSVTSNNDDFNVASDFFDLFQDINPRKPGHIQIEGDKVNIFFLD